MGVVATWPWWGWPPAPPHALHLSLRPLEGALGGVTLMRVVALSHLSEGCTLAPPPPHHKSHQTRFGSYLELGWAVLGGKHIPIINKT